MDNYPHLIHLPYQYQGPKPEKIDWNSVFPQRQALKVEIGPGKGEFLLQLARQQPQYNFIGVEVRWRRSVKLGQLIGEFGLANAKSVAANAKLFLNDLFEPSSVDSFFIHFPDPWPKLRHTSRRLLDTALVSAIYQKLMNTGFIYLTTDVSYFCDDILHLFQPSQFTQIYFHHGEGDMLYHNTHHEAKFKLQKRNISYFCYQKKT